MTACAYAAVADSITLGYTNNDDGVWLYCACGWEHHLGFSATPEQSMSEARRHKIEAAEAEILGIVADLYDRYAVNAMTQPIIDRLITAEDQRRATS